MYKKGDFCVMNDNQLKAVHDDDLETLLTSLGYIELVKSGNCKCIFCNDVINLESLGSIIPKDGEIQFSCNKIDCYNKLTKIGE